MDSAPKKGSGVLKVILILVLVLAGINLVFHGVQKTVNYFQSPVPPPPKVDPVSTPSPPPEPEPPPPSPPELLKGAKKSLSEKSAAFPFGNYPAAYIALNRIPRDSNEYSDAEKLLKQCALAESKTRQHDLKKAQGEKKALRLLYGPILENKFLDKGYDITVKISGQVATTLQIKYILVSRVMVHHILKDHQLIQTWRDMGFKKIIFTDGYRGKWIVDL